MAADVVGYSRMDGAGRGGNAAALKQQRQTILNPIVAQHQGRIVKVMGDGVLVEFASAVNAVKCAIDLRDKTGEASTTMPDARRIVLRIGSIWGDIVVEGGDIYGDGVNIAARLEGMADPGSIVMSRKVYEEIERKLEITCDDLGERSFKNIAAPTPN